MLSEHLCGADAKPGAEMLNGGDVGTTLSSHAGLWLEQSLYLHTLCHMVQLAVWP